MSMYMLSNTCSLYVCACVHVTIILCIPSSSSLQSSLVDVCRSKNVGWFEDPTNSAPTYKRNVIRQALAEQPHLVPAVLGLMETFTAAKTRLDNQGWGWPAQSLGIAVFYYTIIILA